MATGGVRLDLQVGLDLAYLRSQLSGLGTLAQKYSLPIKARLDTTQLQKQLKAVSKEVRLNINDTSVVSATKNTENLIKQLNRLNQASARASAAAGAATGAAVGAGPSRTFRQVISDLDVNQLRSLAQAAAQDGIVKPFEESILKSKSKLLTALNKAANDAGQGFINGLGNQQSALAKAAGDYANALISGIKTTLKIASPSKKMEELGDDAGKGFEKGFLNSLDDAFDAIERKMRQRGKILDTIARGIFSMLGMDSAAMLQAAKEARALPGINWASSVPRQPPSTGPSGTGRLLSGTAPALGLPGTAFSSQKRLLGNRLDEELKDILRGAANTFVDTVRAEMNAAVRSVQVRDLGNTLRTALAPSRVAGLLPAAVGRAPSVYASAGMSREERFAQRTATAYMRSGQRSVDVMAEGRGGRPSSPYSYAYRSPRPQGAIVPYAPGGAMVFAGGGGNPPIPPGGGGGSSGGFFGGMGGSFRNILGGLNLPGTEVIREFGNEFKYATQQVLLFGTAYKALAFLTGFPQQVGNAVGALQSYRNSLKAISPSAEEARVSNEQLLSLVDRYNIPLQSARDGFVKLYASMQPAGFSGDEIRGLFEGVSKAAATYGMSADKVDRVTYAFAQMASKGQVMSEELKGQLGDVLPGAMGLFAKAAGFDGPEAISKFSAALEDGAYKGDAMRALLKNVTIEMNKEFGPGAEGAARTFQGVMNRMQNSLTILYEAFEPAAVNFLNTFVMPLTDGIKTVTDGFNSFFTGMQAQSAGGSAIAAQLNEIKPSLAGIADNIKQLVPLFQALLGGAFELGKVLLSIAGNPIIGFFGKLYAIAFTLNLLIGTSMIQSLVRFVAQIIAVNAQLTAMTVNTVSSRVQLALLANGTTGAGFAFSSAARQITAFGVVLRTVIATTVVGFALVAIGMLIERMQALRAEADAIKNAGKGAKSSVISAYTGGRNAGRSAAAAQEKEALSASRLSGIYRSLAEGKKISEGDIAFAQGLGANLPGVTTQGRNRGAAAKTGLMQPVFKGDYERMALQQAQRAENIRAGTLEGQRIGETQAAAMERQLKTQQEKIKLEGGKGTKGEDKEERESKMPVLMLELATTKQIAEIERDIITAQLGGNELEVIRLQGLKEQLRLNEEVAKVKLQKDVPAEEKALQIAKLRSEQDIQRAKTSFEIESKIQEQYQKLSEAVIKIGTDAAAELQDRKEYERLIRDGIRPEIAKITVETARQFATEQEKLELLEKQIKAYVDLLEAKKAAAKGNDKEVAELQAEIDKLRKRLKDIIGAKGALPGMKGDVVKSRAEAIAPKAQDVIIEEEYDKIASELEKLTSISQMVISSAEAIGSSFAQSFKDIISGAQTAQQALANFFQRIADSFLDMAAQMIQKWIQMQILGLAKSLLPSPASLVQGVDVPVAQMPTGMAFANGGIASGGFIPFKAFATGGTVSGPTLGLVGEGRYNEAIVPLPDGRSIPVELSGGNDGGGNNVQVGSINITVENTGEQLNSQAQKQIASQVRSVVLSTLVNEKRSGGILR